MTVQKILAPADGSNTAKAAVRFAKDIAVAEHAEVVVVGLVHDLQYGDAADVDADLIAMGTHGRTGLGRTMIGSVADRAVRNTEVPVLLVLQR